MRLLSMLILLVVFSGCLGTADFVAQPTLRCFDAGPQVLDIVATQQGGRDERTFRLSEGCALTIDFRLDRAAGDFALSIVGPNDHKVLDIERHGLAAGGGSVALPPRSAHSVKEGPAPAGEYTYQWSASHIAEFALTVEAVEA